MPTSSPVYSVALPLDVRFEPLLKSDPPQWLAVSGTPTARNVIGRFTADQLTEAGVDVGRLQRPDENDDQYRARRVFESLGTASCCWENMDGTGVFDSTRAAEVGLALLADLGIRAPEGYNPPTPEPFTELLTTDTPDAVDPVETPPPFTGDPAAPGAFVFAESVDDEPETMFAGTEPQQAPPSGADMLERLRSEQALGLMVNAIGWVALEGDDSSSEPITATDEQVALLERAARRARSHLEAYLSDTDGRWGIPVSLWTGRRGVAADDVAELVDRYGALGVALSLLEHDDVVADPEAFIAALPDAWRRHTAAEAVDETTETADAPELESEHVWRDRYGDPLRPGDRAHLYVDDPPTEVTVVGLVDNFPDQVVQVRRPDGTTVLAIAHVDLLAVP